MVKITLQCKEREKNIPGSIPLSQFAPKVNGVYAGPRSNLHRSFMEIHPVVSKHTNIGEILTSLAEVSTESCPEEVSLWEWKGSENEAELFRIMS